MKTLIALNVLQTIGIVVLIVLMIGREPTTASHPRASNQTATQPIPFASSSTGEADLLADEARLRGIVREELAQHPQTQPPRGNEPPATAASQPRNAAVDLNRQASITQQIAAYQAAGSISDEQMQELHVEIAQLDETSRKQMMSKLIRAMNAGDIKGRL